MKEYLRVLQEVKEKGEIRHNRTGIDTISLFGVKMEFNLADGFPLLTTKKIFFKGVIGELVWFLHGDTNIKFLNDNGIHIWDAWANADGELGPIYGKQWRDWNGKDQIKDIINLIKNDPNSRRIILSNWNVSELDRMALPPCHILSQFYVRKQYLDCAVYQRSGDMFLGIPFDIASYAALISLLAEICKLSPGKLIYNIGDAHIYTNHLQQVNEQLNRKPSRLPLLVVNPNVDIDNVCIDDFVLLGYNPMPSIEGEVAV